MAGALFGLGAITVRCWGPPWAACSSTPVLHWDVLRQRCPSALLGRRWRGTSFAKRASRLNSTPHRAVGAGLLGLGMISLQYVLEEGNRDGWLESPLIAFMLVVAVISLVHLRRAVLEVDNPIVDLRVFKGPLVRGGDGGQLPHRHRALRRRFSLLALLRDIMHYRALDIGLIFLKASWIQLLLLPIIGRNLHKVDSRYLILLRAVRRDALDLAQRQPHAFGRHDHDDLGHLSVRADLSLSFLFRRR